MATDTITSSALNTTNSGRSSVLDKPQYRGLRPFKPGQSGNPSGRPKKITSALDRALNRHNTKRIAYAMVAQASAGNVAAFTTIRDTIEGPLPRPVQLTGAEGGPILLSHRFELAMNRINQTVIDCSVDNGDNDSGK